MLSGEPFVEYGIVEYPQFPRIGERAVSDELLAPAIPPSFGFSLAVTDHGDRAILAVTAHVWSDDALHSGEATGGTYVEVVAGGGEDCVVSVGLR